MKTLDQTGWMTRQIRVFTERTLFCLFCRALAHLYRVENLVLSVIIMTSDL